MDRMNFDEDMELPMSPSFMHDLHEGSLDSASMDIDQIDDAYMMDLIDDAYELGSDDPGIPLLWRHEAEYTYASCSSMDVEMSDDSDDSESMNWSSEEDDLCKSSSSSSLPLSSPTKSCSNKHTPPQYLTWLPGTLAKLPLELVFTVLDDIFLGRNPRLTHRSLHDILSLQNSSKHTMAMVSSYFNRDPIVTYLHQQLNDWDNPSCAKWYRSHPDAFVELIKQRHDPYSEQTRNLGTDIITQTIIDDCPTCFDWLCTKIPALSSAHTGCNENGWIFIALAIRSASYKMLKRFFSAHSPFTIESPALMLVSPANVLQTAPTGLGMLAYQQDPVFADKVLDLVGPVALRNLSKRTLEFTFEDEEKIMLCRYVTPRTGEWLIQLNIKIWQVLLPTNSPWHASVFNGPEFMEFLYKHDPDNLFYYTCRGAQPLDWAVWANRLDSFRWIIGKIRELDAEKGLPGRRDSLFQSIGARIIDIISGKVSDESEIMLNEILPEPEPRETNYFVAGKLFKNIVVAVKNAVLLHAVRSDWDNETFEQFRTVLEDAAVRKCLAVSRAYYDANFKLGKLSLTVANSQHADAIVLAKRFGFERLESTIYLYHGITGESESDSKVANDEKL